MQGHLLVLGPDQVRDINAEWQWPCAGEAWTLSASAVYHPPDEVVDDVAAAGVAAAVAEPALGGVTHHQGGRVADAAVAAALPETR